MIVKCAAFTPTCNASSPSSQPSQQQPKSLPDTDWRRRARPISPSPTAVYPAKENCSRCGICDTYYIAHVKEACAFLGDGMSKIPELELSTHGRQRRLDDPDELRFGVYEDIVYARTLPTHAVPGAQWTGIVTSIACKMLESRVVDAVVCVQSDPEDRFGPRPIVARTVEDVIAAKGVKPTLSPNLNVLATVEALSPDVKKLLFIGVGCQVQALRSIEKYLNLDKLYVLGTNCVDNGPREGLEKFLQAASNEPETVLHYEFMQDYRVHLKHTDGSFEKIPYFCLPADDLNDVIAPSCYSCFDYTNACADLVVGYMGVPYNPSTPMTSHLQYLTVRNARGREMLQGVADSLEVVPPMSKGNRAPFVVQTVLADDEAKMKVGRDASSGATAKGGGAPRWLGEVLATVLTWIGPQGLEFAKYSIDYHYCRNFIHVQRHWKKGAGDKHIPEFAKKIVDEYDKSSNGLVRQRAAMPAAFPGRRTGGSSGSSSSTNNVM